MGCGSKRRSDPVNVQEQARLIIEHFPRDFDERDPFKVLIRTVLSQRTRDENTDQAAQKLFQAGYDNPEKLANADPGELYDLIKPAGMYRQKAERIVKIAQYIVKKLGGRVPDSLEGLTKLPGVGRKTANIVLFVSFGKPAIAVDTHVHRISNRLGWVRTKTPEETEKALMELLPKDLWGPINGSMVEFGRRVCLPRNPKCAQCPLRKVCPSSTHQK